MSSLIRPLGTYLIAGTAFYAQIQTNNHLIQMSELATASAALSLSADEQLESSFALQGNAATDAEEGLELQAQSVEHELDAAKMEMESASELAISEEYAAEADAFHEHSAVDAAESTAFHSSAKELQLQSSALQIESESNLAASAINEDLSLKDMAESMKAGEVATASEEKGAEYEALALRKEGQSVKDGEALLKTETGAMEDVEVMAACAPIPGLNFICEAVGSIVEVGYQSVAAIEGAKAGIETIQGVTAAQKGRAEMVLAMKAHEEEARMALEAEQSQIKADEESANALKEAAESKVMNAEANEAELAGNEKAHQSEEDEAVAVVNEEVAAEHKSVAARDEAIAIEDEELAISSQMKSEEMLSESTSEEFESMADQEGAETEMAEADRLLKQSVEHGVLSLRFALQAIITAGLVVYSAVMRGMTKIVFPGLTNIWNSGRECTSTLSAMHILESCCDALMHLGIAVGSIVSMPNLLMNFNDSAVHLKVRTLIILAVVAGVIESLGIHATCTMISRRMEGRSVGSTVAMTIQTFSSFAVHLVPTVLMETLMMVAIFRQGFFDKVLYHVDAKPAWIWFGISLLLVVKLKVKHIKHESLNVNSNDAGEHELLHLSDVHHRNKISNLNKMEYGSMEDVGLLSSSSSDEHDHVESMMSSTVANGTSGPSKTCMGECIQSVSTYFERLRRWSDLLVLTIMIALLWHCWPALTVLHPYIKPFEGMITDWVPLPYLVVATLAVAIIFHVLFVL